MASCPDHEEAKQPQVTTAAAMFHCQVISELLG